MKTWPMFKGTCMADFVVVAHSHAFMMRMRKTIELTKAFLRTGSFQSDTPDASR